MSTTDFIALFAVIAGIAATIVSIVGWRENRDSLKEVAEAQATATGKVNKQLEAMREEFALAREERQYIVEDQISDLKLITSWLQSAHLLAGEIWIADVSSIDQPEKYLTDRIRELEDEVKSWDKGYSKMSALAIQYDVAPSSLPREEYFRLYDWQHKGELPSNLYVLLEAVRGQVYESMRAIKSENTSIGGETMDIQEQVEKLFLKGLQLISNIRKGIFSRNR